MGTIPVSVLILTKNEEINLPGCLESVRWSNDVHVLDSLSTDDTVKIAESFGATVTFRPFDSFSQHQNWAMENVPFKYPWVFYLDADERATSELAESIGRAAQNPGEYVAFNIQRRDFFMGRWLKHVQATPYYARLFMPTKMRYERLGLPKSAPDGPVGSIVGYLDHFPFNKGGLTDWFAKHNFYSTQEAQQTLIERESGSRIDYRELFFAKSFHKRRKQLKLLFYRLPFRPTLKFLWLYVLKGGFLDGLPGLTYARLMLIYEQMIILKTRELSGRKS